jgi:hypothetical protein
MGLGTALFVSTTAVLAYHFFLIPVRENQKVRKVSLWVLGVALIVFIAFVIWAES